MWQDERWKKGSAVRGSLPYRCYRPSIDQCHREIRKTCIFCWISPTGVEVLSYGPFTMNSQSRFGKKKEKKHVLMFILHINKSAYLLLHEAALLAGSLQAQHNRKLSQKLLIDDLGDKMWAAGYRELNWGWWKCNCFCVRRCYWGLLPVLSGLLGLDKSLHSLNMLSILYKPPDTNPLYVHIHPPWIRAALLWFLIRSESKKQLAALYLPATRCN